MGIVSQTYRFTRVRPCCLDTETATSDPVSYVPVCSGWIGEAGDRRVFRFTSFFFGGSVIGVVYEKTKKVRRGVSLAGHSVDQSMLSPALMLSAPRPNGVSYSWMSVVSVTACGTYGMSGVTGLTGSSTASAR